MVLDDDGKENSAAPSKGDGFDRWIEGGCRGDELVDALG